ncbi:Serine carboxypeptidase A [Cladobotryum mycophilum]|uniref:Carboxypeptidase n=1 Tax=Cladobotryum mycophilum TaxID=491253 RepID=A0ABR0SH50_9HYPO
MRSSRFGPRPVPPKPEGVTVLKSKLHDQVSISYKEPGLCETTPGVKSFAGHVHLPPGILDDVNGHPQDYPMNTFFWFFEARKDPENAPLAIWLNGGPGASSVLGLFMESGPCIINADSKTTSLNPWSWNNEVNMLYIDQPNQVGFSYDTPTNFTRTLDGTLIPTDFSDGVPPYNLTARPGTYSSQNESHTVNTTAQASHALWHFAQTWFAEFPHYKPNDDRVSIWAESYGGHYGPSAMRFFQQQNKKIDEGAIDAHYIHLDTLGIINGYLDATIQEEAYITFPYNNTYGLQIFNESIYEEMMHNHNKPGGCKDQMKACEDALAAYDIGAVNSGKVDVDSICNLGPCKSASNDVYLTLDHAWLDIAHPSHDPFPAPLVHGYLTQASVLEAIGSPVNFSYVSDAVANSFTATFDEVHGGFVDAVGYLLDNGIKVHMMYGDRDYACNWVGGEVASLAVKYSRSEDFARAGYAPFDTSTGVAGFTRQVGNYSFSRVFQAGHMIPSYQPEAAYEIFMRATFDRDIPTGRLRVTDDLSTEGPLSTWHIKNDPPKVPKPRCYVLDSATCIPEVWAKVLDGTAKIKDFFVIEDEDEEPFTEEL